MVEEILPRMPGFNTRPVLHVDLHVDLTPMEIMGVKAVAKGLRPLISLIVQCADMGMPPVDGSRPRQTSASLAMAVFG